MTNHAPSNETAVTAPQGAATGKRLGVLLTCFEGAKSAAKARKPLTKQLSEGADRLLDEVVLRVNDKRKVQVYDPHKVLRGTMTSALTWGLFGLVASTGSVQSMVIWAVIGAVCGGGFAYYTEHVLTKGQLGRIGRRMGADTSALLAFVQTPNPRGLTAPAAEYSPVTASVAAIEPDLSARVFSGTSDPVELPPASPSAHTGTVDRSTVLSMLLLRLKGQHSVKGIEPKLSSAARPGQTLLPELVFEVDKQGKAHVSSPLKGVGAMAKSDVISWGLFGLAYGAIVGFASNGGILSFIKSGVVTGIAWAIFGLFAGSLYGLWTGRAISGRRLKGIGPLMPPDTSMLLAWADGDLPQSAIAELSTPDAQSLILRFNTVGHGAVLEV
jgi:membrane associated rhomboid family serine protease